MPLENVPTRSLARRSRPTVESARSVHEVHDDRGSPASRQWNRTTSCAVSHCGYRKSSGR